MKKTMAFWLCLALAVVSLSGCISDDNNNAALSDDETEQSIQSIQSVSSENDPDSTVPNDESSSTTEENSYTSETGGNPDSVAVKEILVTVSEDKYFVDNHEMSFDELVQKIQAENGNTIVRISDEKATLNAFEKLKNYLEDNTIEYELS